MKKVIGILICTALLLVLAPLSVSAATHDIHTDGSYDLAADLIVNSGDTISIAPGVTATLIGDTATTYTNVKIECGAGVNLTLQNVNIDNSANNNTCALSFTGADNSLTIEGVNTLTSGYNKSGIAVETGTALTIDGTGTLTATGGIYGAGIGGSGIYVSGGGAGGTVTINGGTVTAIGGSFSAGIGGAGRDDDTPGGAGGKVTISGGTVNTTGGVGGAGIGGGGGGNNSGGAGGEVTISGGTVTATSLKYGAGIGGGTGHSGGAGGTVKIDNGTVTATGGIYGAGIGGGSGRGGVGGAGGEVTINAGAVKAKGGDRGAGIGGGNSESPGKGGAGGTVTINGGRVEATGGNDAAGIGGAYHGDGATVTIEGGTIIATGGNDAAGIGGGFARAGGTVTISGGSVKATAGGDAENIGRGSNAADSGTLTNKGSVDVFLITVTLESVSTATTITSLTTDAGYTYGTNDTETDGAGTLYLYLPENTLTTAGSAGTVNYKAPNGEIKTKNDGAATGTLYIPPTVTATTPSGTDAATAGDVTVTFDQAMDSAIGEIKLNGNALAAGSWTDTQNYKAPYSGLAHGTHYALTISRFKDSINGVEMDTDTSHSFTTRAARSGGSSTFADMEVPPPPVLDNPFTDIAEGDWFYDDVLYVYNKGIMVGVSPQHFAPDTPLTRGMFVTLLYRISGESGSYENPFSDITAGAWYENATAWATAAGICQGIGDGLFAPEQEISREQLAVMLYNYAKYQGYDLSLGADTNILSYNDALNISEYAFAALQWACGIGLIQGDGQGNLNPTGQATRAETAAILHRFLE